MTTTAASTRTGRLADRGRTTHVLIDDDRGRLTLRRLRPWHRIPAQFVGARLDRELAGGTSPEASASLAARAMRLMSMQFRRDLATSVQRILVAVGQPPAVPPSRAVAARCRASRSAGRGSAGSHGAGRPGRAQPGHVHRVAMVSQRCRRHRPAVSRGPPG